MQNVQKRLFTPGHAAVNIIIVALILLLNSAMLGKGALPVLSSGIRYRTDNGRGIAIECILSWDSKNTDEILDILRSSDTRITFAVTGETARNNPALIKQIVSDGHSILTMGMKASDSELLTEDGLLESIKESVYELGKAGAEVTGFYCASADTVKASRASDRAGLVCCRCTRDLLCARGDSSDVIKRARESAKGGSIIAATPTEAFCEALPDLLVTYRQMGLDVGGVNPN